MCFASLEKLYTHTGLITHCADQSCSILADAQLPQETSSRNTFHNLDAGAQRSYSVKLAVVPWKGLWLVHWGYRKKWIKDFRRMACVAQTSLQFHGGLLILFGGRYKRMGPKPRWIQFRGLCQGFFPRSYWSLGCVCGILVVFVWFWLWLGSLCRQWLAVCFLLALSLSLKVVFAQLVAATITTMYHCHCHYLYDEDYHGYFSL